MSSYSLHHLGTGPVVALAHGAGGGVEANFAGLSAHLPERTLSGVDYPGSGGRPVSAEPLQLEQLADELVEAQVAAGQERFPILGLSMGTAIAVTAAVRHPDRVTGLMLTVGLDRLDAQGNNFATLFARLGMRGQWDELALVMLASVGSPDLLASLTLDEAQGAVDATVADLQAHGAGLIPQMDLVRTVDIREAAARVAVPTLVVGAGQDRIVLPQTTRRLAQAIPSAEYAELPAAGHIFTEAETPEWAGVLSRFLARHQL